jgi:ankyrin repeat protein
MWAARNGHARVVELLLAAGADVAAKAHDGFATKTNDGYKGPCTKHSGCTPSDSFGVLRGRDTALLLAARNGHARVVGLLIAAGADVVAKDNDGY